MGTEENYQPQVRDTTNGPNVHTYIPRSDGAIVIGGVAYFPQAGTATTTIPLSVPIPSPMPVPPVVAPAPVASQLYIIPPGGPAAPAVTPTIYYPQYPPFAAPAQAYTSPYVQNQPAYTMAPQVQAAPQYAIQAAPTATYPNLPHYHIPQPAFHTIGLTGHDIYAQQMATVQGLKMNKGQEMKPADDDPLRMYWVRELDGTYTQRNRLTIDSGDIGDVRWYVHDGGVFYAVRLNS